MIRREPPLKAKPTHNLLFGPFEWSHINTTHAFLIIGGDAFELSTGEPRWHEAQPWDGFDKPSTRLVGSCRHLDPFRYYLYQFVVIIGNCPSVCDFQNCRRCIPKYPTLASCGLSTNSSYRLRCGTKFSGVVASPFKNVEVSWEMRGKYVCVARLLRPEWSCLLYFL